MARGISRTLCSRHRWRTVERTISPPGFSSSANSLRPPSTSPLVSFHLLPRLLFESVPPPSSLESRNESPSPRRVESPLTKCKPLNASRPTLLQVSPSPDAPLAPCVSFSRSHRCCCWRWCGWKGEYILGHMWSHFLESPAHL